MRPILLIPGVEWRKDGDERKEREDAEERSDSFEPSDPGPCSVDVSSHIDSTPKPPPKLATEGQSHALSHSSVDPIQAQQVAMSKGHHFEIAKVG